MVTLEDLNLKRSTNRMEVINTYQGLVTQAAYCMEIEIDLDVVLEKLYRVFDSFSSAHRAYVDELEMDLEKVLENEKSSSSLFFLASIIRDKSSLFESLNQDYINMNNKIGDAEKRFDIAKKLAYAVMKKDEVKMPIIKQFHNYGVGVSGADTSVVEVQMIQTKTANIDNDKEVDKEMSDDQTESKSEKLDSKSTNPNNIKITGQSKNCAEASKALLELVPITAEVSVPFEFHRFIFGQKGIGVREMMNKFDVNIHPARDAKSDIILISGVPTNVDSAKEGLDKKVAEHRTAVFAKDEMMDIVGVTKGHGFKGSTSKWHTKKLPRKTYKGLRKVTLSTIMFTRACHKNYHRRTEINKKTYRIGKGNKMKDRKLTLGTLHYGKGAEHPNKLNMKDLNSNNKHDQMKPFGGECELGQCGNGASCHSSDQATLNLHTDRNIVPSGAQGAKSETEKCLHHDQFVNFAELKISSRRS